MARYEWLPKNACQTYLFDRSGYQSPKSSSFGSFIAKATVLSAMVILSPILYQNHKKPVKNTLDSYTQKQLQGRVEALQERSDLMRLSK